MHEAPLDGMSGRRILPVPLGQRGGLFYTQLLGTVEDSLILPIDNMKIIPELPNKFDRNGMKKWCFYPVVNLAFYRARKG